MRPSSVLIRSNPLVHRLRRHRAMATLYRSIDEEMAIDDRHMASQSPFQPGKPTVMASLVLNRDAHPAEPSPATAEIRSIAPRLSRSDVGPPVVQRQLSPSATLTSSTPSPPPAKKVTTEKPIPAEKPPTAETESADFDWIGEKEWTSLKTFMEGHQKKLAEEKGDVKAEPVQRKPEDAGRDEAREKTRAELVRRQELARRGQLPRAQVEYVSGDEQPRTGLSQPSSPAAVEPVQRLPEEPKSESADQGAGSGIEQTSVPADDAAPIPASPSPVVQRIQAEASPQLPESRTMPDNGVQDAPRSNEPAYATESPIQDGPDAAVGEHEVAAEPSSTEIEDAPDLQRTAEVVVGSAKTGDRPMPEAISTAPAPESKPGMGLGNRILSAAKSLFRGDDGPKESSSSKPDIESEVTVSEEAPDIPDQEVIHRVPDEGDTIVEDVLKPPGADSDKSIKPVDDVESPKIPVEGLVEAGSSTGVVDLKKDLSPENGGVTPAEPATAPDISRKPAEVADTTPEARPPTADRQDALEPARGPEMAEPAESDAPIFSEAARPANFGDEVDTIIQEPQGPAPEAQPPMLQRKEVTETAPGPEMADTSGTAETSIRESARTIDSGDVDDTVIQRTEGAVESLSIKEVGQESPQMPSEAEYQQGLESDLSEPPTQILPLDAVWPVERLDPPTIIPPQVKKGDAIKLGPAVQRKPAGDDIVSSKIHGALKDVAPAQPTDSSIELVTPSRPRPIPPARPQKTAADAQRKPAQTKPPASSDSLPSVEQKSVGEKESPYLVSTEVGDLPSDFWEYLGEKPPPPSSGKSSSQADVGALSPPDLQRATEPSQPLVTQEFPLAGVQRVAAPEQGRGDSSGGTEDSGETEETSSDKQELDISELARQVFPEIKRRLNVDWERGRGQF